MFNRKNFETSFREEYLKLSDKDKLYLTHHKKRYLHTVKLLSKYLDKKPIKVLDIGTSAQTFIIKELFPGIQLSTLDLTDKYKNQCTKKQIIFKQIDLNNNVMKFTRKFDLIIFSEILEHLTRDHTQVLSELKNSLTKYGILFLQTPNFLSLNNRIYLLGGSDTRPKRNVIFKNSINPEAHYYEYQINELSSLVNSIKGLKLINIKFADYYDNIQTALTYKSPKILYFFPAVFYCLLAKTFSPLQRGIELVARNEI